MSGTTVLVVDDEPTIVELLRDFLEADGFRVETAQSGEQAAAALTCAPVDCVLLDVMLPGQSGFDFCRHVRETSDVPILFLSARDGDSDKIRGLGLGGDDYIVKSATPGEVVARVKAVLRRTRRDDASHAGAVLAFGRLVIDLRAREVLVDGALAPLTAREFELLAFLAEHPRQVFTREQLFERLWGEFGDRHTVTVHIGRIREKIEANPEQPRYIVTVWGAGYRFEGARMISLVRASSPVSPILPPLPVLADLVTALAWMSVVLLGLCVLIGLLALVLAATDRKRLTVRGWLALAWLASLLVPVLAWVVCLIVLNWLAALPSRPPPLIPSPSDQQRLMVQILVPIGAFAVTMLCLAWLTGRLVLAPLTAMRHATRQIAAGDLDISLPAPQLREVAEVADAFGAMSGALRHALVRQAELEQERRLFVSAIAHDLRTPLFALRGYLEGLREGIARTPAKTERYVAICQDQADILERLVSDLFTYARLEYLEQTPEREPLDLGALLCNAVESIAPGAESKGIGLRIAAPETTCCVAGDRHMLRRAVDNVLENAIAFTPAGGSVCVAWRLDGDACVFTVSDSGPGFAPDDLPHLFQPLYRGDPSRSRKTGGAGLGLATARRILRAHDGDLTAANAPTGGAHLTARLPAHPAPRQIEALPAPLRATR